MLQVRLPNLGTMVFDYLWYMDSVVRKHMDEILLVCKRHQVESLALFGSAASAKMNPDSDVDLLVRFKNSVGLADYSDFFFNLKADLERILNRSVDLVTEKSLKNTYLIQEIKETKVSIYEAA